MCNKDINSKEPHFVSQNTTCAPHEIQAAFLIVNMTLNLTRFTSLMHVPGLILHNSSGCIVSNKKKKCFVSPSNDLQYLFTMQFIPIDKLKVCTKQRLQ